MKKLFLLLIMGMFMLSFASAVPPFEENVGIENGIQIFEQRFEAIKYNTTFNFHVHTLNISTGLPISNTNVDCFLHLYDMTGNHLYESGPMTKNGNGFDLTEVVTYGNFTDYGNTNAYYISCNASEIGGAVGDTYEITANGQPSPEGVVIVGFGILLLFILAGSVLLIVKAVGNMIDRDFDLLDVAKMWGLFFALLGVNQLAVTYLGNVVINNWLDLFVKLYAFPMVIVPLIAFFLSLFNMNKEQKKRDSQW